MLESPDEKEEPEVAAGMDRQVAAAGMDQAVAEVVPVVVEGVCHGPEPTLQSPDQAHPTKIPAAT